MPDDRDQKALVAERVSQVQALRKVAKRCGVALVPDNASRERVKSLADAVSSSPDFFQVAS